MKPILIQIYSIWYLPTSYLCWFAAVKSGEGRVRQCRTVLKTTSFYLPPYPTPRSLSDREWGGLGWWWWELEQVKGTPMGTASCCDVKSECWSSSWVPTHVVRALQGEALGLVRRNRAGRAAEVGAVWCSRVSRRVRVLQPKDTEHHP